MMLLNLLDRKPMIGVTSVMLGVVMPLIEQLTPLLQFLGLLIGVLIGALTLFSMIRKTFFKSNNAHED